MSNRDRIREGLRNVRNTSGGMTRGELTRKLQTTLTADQVGKALANVQGVVKMSNGKYRVKGRKV